MIDPKTINIKDLVKDGKKVRFSYFRDNEFWYEQEDGFLFPISLFEAQSSKVTFLAEDKAMLFMRWMRKHLDSLKTSILVEEIVFIETPTNIVKEAIVESQQSHWSDYNCTRVNETKTSPEQLSKVASQRKLDGYEGTIP